MPVFIPSRYERLEDWLFRKKERVKKRGGNSPRLQKVGSLIERGGRLVHQGLRFVINNSTLLIVYGIGVGITALIAKILKKDIGFSSPEGTSFTPFEERKNEEYLRRF